MYVLANTSMRACTNATSSVLQDARRRPRRTHPRGVGHHHQQHPGAGRAGPRRNRVHRRLGGLLVRAGRPRAATTPAHHQRRRPWAAQRLRAGLRSLASPEVPDPPGSERSGEGPRRSTDRAQERLLATCATSRSPPATPTPARPCATTAPAPPSTDTPTTSSPPTWPREPEPDFGAAARHVAGESVER